MVVGPHGQEDGLEYEAAPPLPGVEPEERHVHYPGVDACPQCCNCPPCRALAAPATGDE
jgi:hypothetical protein